MRTCAHIALGLLVSLWLIVTTGACSNDNTAPSLLDSLPPGQTYNPSPSSEKVLVQFTELARAGDLDALALVLQDVFAAGGFDDLVDALSIVLDSDRVDQLADILNSLIDRGTVFEFTPIAGDMLITFSADRDPSKPGIQSAYDVLTQLFETGTLTELIVPLRNLLAPEFQVESPFVSDPRIEVIGIQLELIDKLGSQGLQDMLDQLNIGVTPFSRALPPRQAFLLRGNNGSIAPFTALANTSINSALSVAPGTVPVISPFSRFVFQGENLLPLFPGACTPSASPASGYQRSYKVRVVTGLNAGLLFNIASIDSPTQISICDNSFDSSVAPTTGIAVQDDSSFRFDVQAAVPQLDGSGVITRHSAVPVGGAIYAPHNPLGNSDLDFVAGQIKAGDEVRLLSGLNSGLRFTVSVGADKTLDENHPFWGDLLYLGTFSNTGEPYRIADLNGNTHYFISERQDPTLAYQLTTLNLVRDVVPIIERVVGGRVTPDSETLVELLLLVDLVPGSQFDGDDFLNALEVFLLASVRADSNLDGLYDAADNLDRNGDRGCRNQITGAYVFWEQGLDLSCAADFVDVNNDGIIQSGETFDVNGDGVFDSTDFARGTLLNTANCARAKYFDAEKIATQGPDACPPGDGYVDCDLFSEPLNCNVFDTNRDGKLDSFDLIPSVIGKSGHVELPNGFSASDRYPDGFPDGKIDWRDLLNSHAITPSNFLVPSTANPLTLEDHLPRFSQSMGNTILDLFRSDAGESVRRGAEALLFAIDNPANIFIEGRSLPQVALEDLGRLITTQDLNTGEYVIGPTLRTLFALMTDGPKAFDGIHGTYEPRYLPVMQGGVARAKFAQNGSSAYRGLTPLETLLTPITVEGGFGGPQEFPYGAMEFLFKHAFGELACSDPSVTPADCVDPAFPGRRLVAGIERDPFGNINQSLIRHVTADDDTPLARASGAHPFDPGLPLPRALPQSATAVFTTPEQVAFLNLVVNNTSGGDIDNVFSFEDEAVYPNAASDFRSVVPGDFLVIADQPLDAAGTACDDPADISIARTARPEAGPQGQFVLPMLNCDQFQTFDFPYNAQSASVTNVLDGTLYSLTVNGTPVSYTSGTGATSATISAGLTAAVNAAVIAPPVLAIDRHGMVSVESTGGGYPTLVAGANLVVTGQVYRDATIDIDIYDPLTIKGVNAKDELRLICQREQVVCLRILQVLGRTTIMVGLDSSYEPDVDVDGIPEVCSVGDIVGTDCEPPCSTLVSPMPGVNCVDPGSGGIDPGDLTSIVTRGRYYGYLGNYLQRLPRQVFQLYEYHQENGKIPTFDGLEPNFDFSNVDLSLALANSPPDFRPSIGQQITLMFPIIDIDHETSIQSNTDLRAIAGLTGFQQSTVCPDGGVPLLSCGATYVTNHYRQVNGDLPDDRIFVPDLGAQTENLNIISVYDDRIICAEGSLPSSGQVNAISPLVEETTALAGFDPANDICRVYPELVGCETGSAFPPAGSSGATLCMNPDNIGPPVSPPSSNCVAGPGLCSGNYDIRRVASILARLVPTITGVNPKTAEQLVDDTQALTGPLLASGVLNPTDQQAVLTSLDAVTAAAHTGVVPALSRLGQIVARQNLENVDVQGAAIEGARILTRTTQLDNGQITNNRIALRQIEPFVASFFSPTTRFGEDLISLLLALESIPVTTVENWVRVEQPDLGKPCDPATSTLNACENRNNGPDLTADFLRAITTPSPLINLDGIAQNDVDGNPILIRPIDNLTISTDDFLSLVVNCVSGMDQYGNGTPIFNCTSVDNPSQLTLFGETIRDMAVILGQVLQSEEFSTELTPFFASVFKTVVDLLQPQRGDRQENPTLSALRLFLGDSSLEAQREFADAFETLNQSDRRKLISFVVDQFDPDTGAIGGLIDATDPIIRNDPNGNFAAAISDLMSVNSTLPPIECSDAQSVLGRIAGCSTKVLADIPEEDIRFLFDTYVELVDTGSAEALVNILAQIVTTGALERLTPTLLLMSQEHVLDEFIIFQALLLQNGTIGIK